MRFFCELSKAIGFDKEYNEFELLETETGTPPDDPKMGGSREQNRGDEGNITKNLEVNVQRLEELFRADTNKDIKFRRFTMCKKRNAVAVFINGMADNDLVNDFVLKPCMKAEGNGFPILGSAINYIMERILPIDELTCETQISEIVHAVLDGQTAILIENEKKAIIAETRGFVSRSVGESENEKTVIGPKEAYTENLRTNITLLRRIIRSSDLVAQDVQNCISSNNARLVIMYRDSVVNTSLKDEVLKKLSKIDTNKILSVGTIEQLIERPRFIPIPRFLITEKPDKTASHIMQGHIAILLDGSPEALVVPVTLFALMASTEDTYIKAPLGTIIRFVRYVGVLLSVLLPGAFLAMALYHQGVLSTEVLLTVVSARALVHSPIAIELLFLLIVFHMIREAGMRVPGSIGQAIGIIGGLILGQAAVSANVVSTTSLIIVALSGLGNFCVPNYQLMLSITYLRVLALLSAWIAGFLGMSIFLLISVAYIAAQKSFGVPFLAPFAPTTMTDRPFLFRGFVRNHARTLDYSNTKEDGMI